MVKKIMPAFCVNYLSSFQLFKFLIGQKRTLKTAHFLSKPLYSILHLKSVLRKNISE